MPSKILIAYYTRTGNTHTIAEAIQRQIGGALAEIRPVIPYPAQYHAVLKQAQAEIQSNARPAIETGIEHVDAYDTVFVGSPIWWGTVAPPVGTFLAAHRFAGKMMVPFYSHGGGGAGHAENDLARLCPNAIVKPGLAVRGNGVPTLAAQIIAWLARIGVPRA